MTLSQELLVLSSTKDKAKLTDIREIFEDTLESINNIIVSKSRLGLDVQKELSMSDQAMENIQLVKHHLSLIIS